MTNLQLGSLVLNTELLVALAAGIMGLLAVTWQLGKRAERDSSPAWNAILIWILVWKGSLLLTDAAGVMRQPLSLLYYDGGTVGFWLACAATGTYLFLRYSRLYGKSEGWRTLGSFAAGWIAAYTLATIVLDTASVQYGHWFGLFAAVAVAVAMGLGLAGQRGGGGAKPEVSEEEEVEDRGRGGSKAHSSGKRGRDWSRRFLQTAGIVLLLGLLSVTAQDQLEQMLDKRAERAEGNELVVGARVGNAAPSIELDGLSPATIVTLDSYKGKTVLVNFWTTWCRVCMTEMPHVQKLYEQYREQDGDSDVAILSVNATSQEQSAEKVRQYADKRSLGFPIALDLRGEAADVYRVAAYPSTFIVDGDGVIRERFLGAISYEDMKQRIERVRDRYPSAEAAEGKEG